MNKLFESIKEFTYDSIGYMVPGIIVIYLSIIVLKNMQSPMSVFFNNYMKYKDALNIIINVNVVFLAITSYIIGNIFSYISYLIEYKIKDNIIKKSKNAKENDDYMEALKAAVLEKYKNDDVLKLIKTEDEKLKYIKTKASTLSRFENHSDLIQKYIYKSKLYSALSWIFLVLSIDSILWYIFNASKVNLYKLGIGIILILLTIALYKEYKKHSKLRLKESYMYLINKN